MKKLKEKILREFEVCMPVLVKNKEFDDCRICNKCFSEMKLFLGESLDKIEKNLLDKIEESGFLTATEIQTLITDIYK